MGYYGAGTHMYRGDFWSKAKRAAKFVYRSPLFQTVAPMMIPGGPWLKGVSAVAKYRGILAPAKKVYDVARAASRTTMGRGNGSFIVRQM